MGIGEDLYRSIANRKNQYCPDLFFSPCSLPRAHCPNTLLIFISAKKVKKLCMMSWILSRY
jgi:hypothetical protein